MAVLGSDEGGRVIRGQLAVQEFTRKPGELPRCLVKEAGPDPLSYPAACSSQHSDVRIETMMIEFDGLMAAGMFAGVAGIPEGVH